MMYDVVYKFIESEVSVLEGLKCSAAIKRTIADRVLGEHCLLYTSPSPRD